MTAHAATDQIAEIIGLQTALDTKAIDTSVVHKAGVEDVSGLKNFTGGLSAAGTINLGPGVGSPGFNMTTGAGGIAGVFNDGSLNVVADSNGKITRNRANTHITSSQDSLTEFHRANSSGLFTSVPVRVGATSAGSAGAQLESRAATASTPIFAGYDNAGVNRWLVGPKGKVTTPGRDGPIQANTDAATVTFDLLASDKHTLTLGGNRTLALSNEPNGAQQFTLWLTQDGTGSRTVTWWSGIKWSGNTAPTLTTTAGKTDVITFTRMSTGVYYGFVAGLNY